MVCFTLVVLLISHCLQSGILLLFLPHTSTRKNICFQEKWAGKQRASERWWWRKINIRGEKDKPNECSSCVDFFDLEWGRVQLTCCSVQDLGLKEYAGVLVSDAGEEQPLGLHWTTGYYNLRNTGHTVLDEVKTTFTTTETYPVLNVIIFYIWTRDHISVWCLELDPV